MVTARVKQEKLICFKVIFPSFGAHFEALAALE
jgi:hypothetical protein